MKQGSARFRLSPYPGLRKLRRGNALAKVDERYVDRDPDVLEGEDDIPRQPTPERDPFIPEPGPRPGEYRAFRVLRWAWLIVAIVVAIVIWAAVR